jgi:inactivated superfamily I helicase
MPTFQRLLTQLISSTSIPFHGEPAEGIQIMGVLETRNLDFDHVLVLSCNEGNMPKGVNDA